MWSHVITLDGGFFPPSIFKWWEEQMKLWVTFLVTLLQSEVLSNGQFLTGRLLFIWSEASFHLGNRYFRQSATHSAKGVRWLRFHLSPHPYRPAHINPLSMEHNKNGHGLVWFISCRVAIRAQLAFCVLDEQCTFEPFMAFLYLSSPSLSRPHAACPTHPTCHSEDDTVTKTSTNQKKLISN